MDLPVATDDGQPITGQVRSEFIPERSGITSFPLSGRGSARSYPTASLDNATASLTRRRYPQDKRESIPASAWAFARIQEGALETLARDDAVIPSDTDIHMPSGFQPGWIYELVYTGRDPLVMGLGHVAIRDFVSFLKYSDADTDGQPNPVAGAAEKIYGWGRSQTGRCLRDFVYRGFNSDGQGHRAFDGILPHVAGAGRKWMNHRFADLIASGGQEYEDSDSPADRFPFSYAMSTDHLTGQRDAILKRPETDPLVFHTQTATEYWQRRGSLVHTDTLGNDLEQPQNVRVYAWASSQHFAPPGPVAPKQTLALNLTNTVSTSMLFRALLDAMDRWATDGTPPPPSSVPTRADGTLLTVKEWRVQFPDIPGVATPAAANGLRLLDFGPDFDKSILREPPEVIEGKAYTVLVPAVDADGNEVAGVRAPMVQAPLGTYTGWNLRGRGFGHGAMFRFEGSYLPFPDTVQERAAMRDPRAAIHHHIPCIKAEWCISQ